MRLHTAQPWSWSRFETGPEGGRQDEPCGVHLSILQAPLPPATASILPVPALIPLWLPVSSPCSILQPIFIFSSIPPPSLHVRPEWPPNPHLPVRMPCGPVLPPVLMLPPNLSDHPCVFPQLGDLTGEFPTKQSKIVAERFEGTGHASGGGGVGKPVSPWTTSHPAHPGHPPEGCGSLCLLPNSGVIS